MIRKRTYCYKSKRSSLQFRYQTKTIISKLKPFIAQDKGFFWQIEVAKPRTILK